MGVFRVDETNQKDEEKDAPRDGDFSKIETKIGSLESPRTFETFI